jgi:hypothetical protein
VRTILVRSAGNCGIFSSSVLEDQPSPTAPDVRLLTRRPLGAISCVLLRRVWDLGLRRSLRVLLRDESSQSVPSGNCLRPGRGTEYSSVPREEAGRVLGVVFPGCSCQRRLNRDPFPPVEPPLRGTSPRSEASLGGFRSVSLSGRASDRPGGSAFECRPGSARPSTGRPELGSRTPTAPWETPARRSRTSLDA